MKKFIFIFLLISATYIAQINRFIYEYKYIPVIEKKDSILSEMMVLDIYENKSIYQSLGIMQQDSTLQADLQKALIQGGNHIKINRKESFLKPTTKYKVSKEFPNFDVFLHERLGIDAYKIKEDEKLTWKIYPETQEFGEYKGQKATTEFGGKSWIAWFSSDIPFQDGPYKFYGLPGLIIKIEDSTQSHVITLVANKKLKSAYVDKEISLPNGGKIFSTSFGQEIQISEKQFKKLYKEYKNDPNKGLKQMLSGMGGDLNVKSEIKMMINGIEIKDTSEMKKLLNKNIKRIESNNRIEPSLYDN